MLMCPPDHFDYVEYVFNPWKLRSRACVQERARRQWDALYQTLVGLGVQVELLPPQPDLPAQVFTADAGLILGQRVFRSRLRKEARAPEAPYLDAWFAEHGFAAEAPPHGMYFDGAAEALFCGPLLFAGARQGSNGRADRHLAAIIDRPVLSLELIHPRFYHLDIFFCPLAPGEAMYYPAAFDDRSQHLLETNIPKLLAINEADAHRLGCNAVVVGKAVVMNAGCEQLASDLRAWGYEPVAVELDEFVGAGGSARCLTLPLDGEEAAVWN
jgi:N-dimethylarginine dimethylaminohydrolase